MPRHASYGPERPAKVMAKASKRRMSAVGGGHPETIRVFVVLGVSPLGTEGSRREHHDRCPSPDVFINFAKCNGRHRRCGAIADA